VEFATEEAATKVCERCISLPHRVLLQCFGSVCQRRTLRASARARVAGEAYHTRRPSLQALSLNESSFKDRLLKVSNGLMFLCILISFALFCARVYFAHSSSRSSKNAPMCRRSTEVAAVHRSRYVCAPTADKCFHMYAQAGAEAECSNRGAEAHFAGASVAGLM
jgi:hypothetical protein